MKRGILFFLLFFILIKVSKGQDTLILDVQSLQDTSKMSALIDNKVLSVEDVINLKSNNWFFLVKPHNHAFGIKIQNTSGNRNPKVFNIDKKDTTFTIKNDTLNTTNFKFGKNFELIIHEVSGNQKDLKRYSKLTISTGDTTNKKVSGSSQSEPSPFIDSVMIASIRNVNNCQSLCGASKDIKSRKHRMFSTDYYIVFDASRKFDDYTICKHIYKNKRLFRDKDNKLLQEMYRKVAPAWFAPSIGSQLKFEVINMPLTNRSKITVSDTDLFTNSSSFQNVLNNQLGATILKSIPSSDKTVEDSVTTAQGKAEEEPQKLDRLLSELSDYVREFNVSACTVDANKNNMLVILTRIKSQFQLSGNNVMVQLANRFKDNEELSSKVEAINDLITALQSVKPLVYSTARLRNRDFINIKVTNGDNEVIADENIRTSFGLKIDYSAGIFLTGLKDFNYIFKDTIITYYPDGDTTKPLRDTSGRYIFREKDDRINVGFGFLAHVYPRFSSNYNIGLTCGLMSTIDLDLNVLLGGSVMFQSLFGTNTRIAFSGGIAWGKVNRLSNSAFNGIKTINGIPVFYSTTLNAPPIVEVWEKSWFFGATFNF